MLLAYVEYFTGTFLVRSEHPKSSSRRYGNTQRGIVNLQPVCDVGVPKKAGGELRFIAPGVLGDRNLPHLSVDSLFQWSAHLQMPKPLAH
tara:strand:- start:2159 stop:2428 length:270 start_codon:yes stop_codon:yes gene_type:complete